MPKLLDVLDHAVLNANWYTTVFISIIFLLSLAEAIPRSLFNRGFIKENTGNNIRSFLRAASAAFMMTFISFLIVLLVRFGDRFILDTPIPVILFLAACAAALLYRLRTVNSFGYGLTEIAASLVVIGVSDYSAKGDPLAKAVAILGGIYIFVRGLDNMQKALPPSWKGVWKTLFGRKD